MEDIMRVKASICGRVVETRMTIAPVDRETIVGLRRERHEITLEPCQPAYSPASTDKPRGRRKAKEGIAEIHRRRNTRRASSCKSSAPRFGAFSGFDGRWGGVMQ